MTLQINVDGASIQSIVRRLRLHAGVLHGPNHDTSREAATALEKLHTIAANVVRSHDNWQNVWPVNPQVYQDIQLLREAIDKDQL